MKQIAIILMTISFMLSSSCNQRQDDESVVESIIKFSPTKNDYALLKDISVQLLQLDDSVLVGSITSIMQSGDTLIVNDSQQNIVWAFDRSGVFIDRIGSRGQGHGEYIKTTEVFLDRQKHCIGVLDDHLEKILYYGLKNFSFIDVWSYPDHILTNFCLPFDDGYIWNNQTYDGENSDWYFITTDAEGNVTDKYVRKDFKSGYFTGASEPLYTVEGDFYGYTPYDMTIYHFIPGKPVTERKIEIEGYSTPTLEYLNACSNGGKSPSLFKGLEDSDYIRFYSISEGNSLLLVNMKIQKQGYFGIENKATGATTFLTKEQFDEKLGLGKTFFPINGTIDGKILMAINVEDLKDAIASGQSVDPRLKEIATTGNDNPVIAILDIDSK